ncbi:MAG: GntR family transcriptional regulator [Spirochaetaceae bacterium]
MSFEKIGIRETLPEKVFKAIKESILSGELDAGSPLPTEPELEKQFGVSRAVIRDAVRMLKGQGLIVIKHGKGMYVSSSQTEAFTDALLTSLRRDNATAWDVEQFESIFLPQIISISATEATEKDITNIKEAGKNYLDLFEKHVNDDFDKTKLAFALFMSTIFISTHNKLIILLGDVLVSLRKFRDVSTENIEEEDDTEQMIKLESLIINRFILAIETRNPDEAAKIIRESITFDSSIVSILKQTPVGTSPKIPGDLFFKAYKDRI